MKLSLWVLLIWYTWCWPAWYFLSMNWKYFKILKNIKKYFKELQNITKFKVNSAVVTSITLKKVGKLTQCDFRIWRLKKKQLTAAGLFWMTTQPRAVTVLEMKCRWWWYSVLLCNKGNYCQLLCTILCYIGLNCITPMSIGRVSKKRNSYTFDPYPKISIKRFEIL